MPIAEGEVLRPRRSKRRRLVLVAAGRADLDLLDPAGHRGPAAAEELPLSPTLRHELDRLRTALHEPNGEALPGTLDGLISAWEDEALEEAVRDVGNGCARSSGRRARSATRGRGCSSRSGPLVSPLAMRTTRPHFDFRTDGSADQVAQRS